MNLINFVLSGLSCGKDNRQLLTLVCGVQAMGGSVWRIMATEQKEEVTIELLDADWIGVLGLEWPTSVHQTLVG